ncbi:SDR family oxidoreductase [Roseibium sp. RKSG952]|uniref:SDR family oxidoreductase n=1 Tax=Roseibium sp. RKSG952 TaxID=2529384 RepID=UPI0012BCF978|nr:NmrA family NAD(P)-binding protein [Roseibium sp. RKSG952]MTH97499.1 NAD-dependent epimerase/dehydratase family protein [Roseibium sp. RKSG952]
MILVVGATGTLGSSLCADLLANGHDVRAVVRESSKPESVARLEELGAQTVVADLRNRRSIVAALNGVRVVVSTATSVSSSNESNTFDTVDRNGQLDLLTAAQEQGVEHFIYVSFPPFEGNIPLQEAKRTVERALHAGNLPYTVLQVPYFQESWLAAPLGVNPETGAMQTFGGGSAPISWISIGDVCAAIRASLTSRGARNRTLKVGGKEALSQKEVIARCEKLSGRQIEREDTPKSQLEGMASSSDPLLQTFSGLMKVCGDGGCVIDNSEAEEVLGYRPQPIDDYLAKLAASLPSA